MAGCTPWRGAKKKFYSKRELYEDIVTGLPNFKIHFLLLCLSQLRFFYFCKIDRSVKISFTAYGRLHYRRGRTRSRTMGTDIVNRLQHEMNPCPGNSMALTYVNMNGNEESWKKVCRVYFFFFLFGCGS